MTLGHKPVVLTGTARDQGVSGSSRGDTLRVALQRPAAVRTRDQAFWSLIRSCTAQISAARYAEFIERVLCAQDDPSFVGRRLGDRRAGWCATRAICSRSPTASAPTSS